MNRWLLDTHTVVWSLNDDPKLSREAAELIESTDTNLFVSVATLWEMAIKHGLGKLPLAVSIDKILPTLQKYGIEILEINPAEALAVASLPLHHRDPFDRLLAMQSLANALPIISRDGQFDNYGVRRIW